MFSAFHVQCDEGCQGGREVCLFVLNGCPTWESGELKAAS